MIHTKSANDPMAGQKESGKMTSRIFETNYQDYRNANWLGTLPVGPNKGLLVSGFTGKIHRGIYPSDDQVVAWASNSMGDQNIGLRMPVNVIGIDVDDYEEKNGAVELSAKEALWGALPASYSSTARGPHQPSRINFYRVPEGLGGRDRFQDARAWTSSRPTIATRLWPPALTQGFPILSTGGTSLMVSQATTSQAQQIYQNYLRHG